MRTIVVIMRNAAMVAVPRQAPSRHKRWPGVAAAKADLMERTSPAATVRVRAAPTLILIPARRSGASNQTGKAVNQRLPTTAPASSETRWYRPGETRTPPPANRRRRAKGALARGRETTLACLTATWAIAGRPRPARPLGFFMCLANTSLGALGVKAASRTNPQVRVRASGSAAVSARQDGSEPLRFQSGCLIKES